MTTLHAFEIPENDAALAAWLEAQLAGPYLGELVAELAVLQEIDPASHGPRPDRRSTGQAATIETVLGNRLPQVCQQGLASVPPNLIRRLFQQPHLLAELQERVLTDGGPFWDQKLQESTELSEMMDAGWTRLTEGLSRLHAIDPAEQPVQFGPVKTPTKPFRWFLAGVVSAAAVGLIAVVVWDQVSGPQQVASTEWGWNRPDVFKPDLSRAAYLERLATSAEEWKRKKPETPEALARRIVQFREGCTRLILAKHEPLTPKDGAWLRERCRVWSKKLDEQLAALESGGDVTSVRNQVDGVVDKLAKALRERAAHVGEA
jgi:hypothetical protein